jgi:hypothetical protein
MLSRMTNDGIQRAVAEYEDFKAQTAIHLERLKQILKEAHKDHSIAELVDLTGYSRRWIFKLLEG